MIVAPLMAYGLPILICQIVLAVLSVILAIFILIHKNRGGGMSDLFGGGMSTSMGGQSVVERNLDRMTIIVTLLWLADIVALLAMYRLGAK